ncbi:hypothetical protein D0Y65_020643 [Glycine soja]|uniref:Uncharacterized protein n=1 Tax=Glycine soja TaxID=3848 RepID=A0A445JF17_GLYSO|nr:hypothetical protein D0Y65_020643 [Glycine soja]
MDQSQRLWAIPKCPAYCPQPGLAYKTDHNGNVVTLFIAMASPARTFFAFILAVVALFFAAAANAQDLSPAPSPDAGAAGSVSSSVAMIGASVVLSLMAILKH